MSRDIVNPFQSACSHGSDREWPANQLARLGIENTNVAVCDEELNRPSLVGPADADVVEL